MITVHEPVESGVKPYPPMPKRPTQLAGANPTDLTAIDTAAGPTATNRSAVAAAAAHSAHGDFVELKMKASAEVYPRNEPPLLNSAKHLRVFDQHAWQYRQTRQQKQQAILACQPGVARSLKLALFAIKEPIREINLTRDRAKLSSNLHKYQKSVVDTHFNAHRGVGQVQMPSEDWLNAQLVDRLTK